MQEHVWDHTRSPWWNLTQRLGLQGGESSLAAAATTILVIASLLVPVRAGTDPAIEIVSSVQQPTAGPTDDGGTPSGEDPGAVVARPTGEPSITATPPSFRPTPGATLPAGSTQQQGTSSSGTGTNSSPQQPEVVPLAPSGSSSGSDPQPTAQPTTQPSAQPSPSAPPAPPKEELVIGFLRQTGTGESAGFTTPEQGDVENQINTLMQFINDNGGLAGHPVRASIRTVDINNTGRPQEEATCRAFAEEDGAFAVVPLALIYAESRACYADRGVVLVDPTPFHQPESLYTSLAPHIIQTSYPSTEKLTRAQAEALSRAGFFDDPGFSLGFVGPDTPQFRRVFEETFVPTYAAYGVTVDDTAWIANDSIQSAQTGSSNASLRFATGGITHVVFYGNSLLAPLFMKNAEGNAYFPRYGLTSFDQLLFMADQWSTEQSLTNSVGAGFSPALDVPDSELAFPTPAEQPCIDLMRAGGNTWDSRTDAKNALGYCDAVFLMKQAADTLGGGSLTAQTLYDAVFTLGDSYQSSLAIGTSIQRGSGVVSSQYRPLAYDNGCGCYQYTGGAVRIP